MVDLAMTFLRSHFMRYLILLALVFIAALSVTLFVPPSHNIVTRAFSLAPSPDSGSALKYIMLHNFRCFLVQWCGAILLGIPTVAEIAMNGLVFGAVLRNFPFNVVLGLLLPHAILENAAFIVNGAAVLAYIHQLLAALVAGVPLRRGAHRALFAQTGTAILMLTVAALIEGLITVKHAFA